MGPRPDTVWRVLKTSSRRGRLRKVLRITAEKKEEEQQVQPPFFPFLRASARAGIKSPTENRPQKLLSKVRALGLQRQQAEVDHAMYDRVTGARGYLGC